MSRIPKTQFVRAPKLRGGTAANHLSSLGQQASPRREFDERTGILRFMVPLAHELVTAYISRSTWQARYGLGTSDASLLELYLQNQPMIDAIVAGKVNAGARNPVVLRAADL